MLGLLSNPPLEYRDGEVIERNTQRLVILGLPVLDRNNATREVDLIPGQRLDIPARLRARTTSALAGRLKALRGGVLCRRTRSRATIAFSPATGEATRAHGRNTPT